MCLRQFHSICAAVGARDLIIAAPAGSAQKAIGKHRSLAKVFLSGTRIYVCICMGAVADLVRIQRGFGAIIAAINIKLAAGTARSPETFLRMQRAGIGLFVVMPCRFYLHAGACCDCRR